MKLLRRFYETSKPLDSVLGVQGRFRRTRQRTIIPQPLQPLSVSRNRGTEIHIVSRAALLPSKRARGKPPIFENVILAKDDADQIVEL
jgi:hypothetical protein